MTPVSTVEDIAALWLSLLQRAMSRASHDVKDALNGVSVNLEVIRSRASRPDLPASALAQFGDAAAQQLERLTILMEAVLVLSRPERTPADVGHTLRRIGALCSASASSADAAVRIEVEGTSASSTSVRGDAVRVAIMAPLLDVVAGADRRSRASDVTCTLAGDDDAVLVTIAAGDRVATMPEIVAEPLRAAGVRWTESQGTLSLAFPRS